MNSQELISALRNTPSRSKRKLLDEAADLIENQQNHIAALMQANDALRPRWIPVTERLPEAGETVLAVVYGRANANVELIGAIELAVRRKYGWLVEAWPDLSGTVTHWLPLPAGPEVE